VTPDDRPVLPRILVASDGRSEWVPPENVDAGLLLRDTTLGALVRHSDRPYVVAVDTDSVEGLADDEAGLHFLVAELGFRVFLTHHSEVACRLADIGALALMRVSALDSSGLARALESHPHQVGVGAVLHPGLVLPHLPEGIRAVLPRPLLAYGLLRTPGDVTACLALADSVVVRPELLHALGNGAEPVDPDLASRRGPTAT
jgi:glycerol-3-phosphate responsive antiterminator